MKQLDIKRLHCDLEYHPAGRLIWSVSRGGVKYGAVAGRLNPYNGYRQVGYLGREWREHRLIWIYLRGEIPEGLVIDHKNRVRSDNRIENLRVVTLLENLDNQARRSVVGVRGITKAGSRFKACICGRYLGTFDYLFEAIAARRKAEDLS